MHYKLVRYQKGDVFKKHRDNGEGYNDRYKTLVIQLSNSEDYKGGDLLIYNNIKHCNLIWGSSKTNSNANTYHFV